MLSMTGMVRTTPPTWRQTSRSCRSVDWSGPGTPGRRQTLPQVPGPREQLCPSIGTSSSDERCMSHRTNRVHRCFAFHRRARSSPTGSGRSSTSRSCSGSGGRNTIPRLRWPTLRQAGFGAGPRFKTRRLRDRDGLAGRVGARRRSWSRCDAPVAPAPERPDRPSPAYGSWGLRGPRCVQASVSEVEVFGHGLG